VRIRQAKALAEGVATSSELLGASFLVEWAKRIAKGETIRS
jgi:hypothetical protein